MKVKIGVQKPIIRSQIQTHDFIEFAANPIKRIFDICSPLYLQGHSISRISDLTGFPASTVHKHLRKGGLTLRPSTKVSDYRKRRQPNKNAGPPPYGYCYINGHMEKDPKEYQIVQIIHQQWKLGKSLMDIARHLNSKKFKTRSLKEWRAPIILKIVQRLKLQTQDS